MPNLNASQLAGLRWAKARKTALTCQECGKGFLAYHRHAQSCSGRCRQRRKYRLKKLRNSA